MSERRRVLVTGGAGYVGSALVPKLLASGYDVTVLDLYLYGRNVLSPVAMHSGLREVAGDMRDRDTVREALRGANDVIHLACISNDPSFELDPDLGRSNQLRLLPDAGGRGEGGRRVALCLCFLVERLRIA